MHGPGEHGSTRGAAEAAGSASKATPAATTAATVARLDIGESVTRKQTEGKKWLTNAD